jgi:hypothetical protein
MMKILHSVTKADAATDFLFSAASFIHLLSPYFAIRASGRFHSQQVV